MPVVQGWAIINKRINGLDEGGAGVEVNRTVVRIAGKEYAMKGTDSQEYMHRVAIFVDRKMAEVEASNNNLSTGMQAVLTCLNIADLYLKQQDDVKRLRESIAALQYENNRLKADMERESKKGGGEAPAGGPVRVRTQRT